MIRFDGSQVTEEFNQLFSVDDGPTPGQCQWLIKVIKHCRGRCRSNTALRNYLTGAFPNLRFTEVNREWKGRTYLALCIEDRLQRSSTPAVEISEDE